MPVVWENEVGDETDKWRLQRASGATRLPVDLFPHKILLFCFVFWCFLSLQSNPVCIRRIEVFWEEDDGGRQSCDRSVLAM